MAKRYMVELKPPARLLLDRAAEDTGKTRSRVIEEALTLYLSDRCGCAAANYGAHHKDTCPKYQAAL